MTENDDDVPPAKDPPRRPKARRVADEDDEDTPRPNYRYRDDDDPDEPYRRRPEGDATGGVIPYKNPKALAAYYCGVFGLISVVLCFGIFGVVPIVLGFMGLKHAKKYPEARGQAHAITGIVLGSLEVLSFLGIIVFGLISWSSSR